MAIIISYRSDLTNSNVHVPVDGIGSKKPPRKEVDHHRPGNAATSC